MSIYLFLILPTSERILSLSNFHDRLSYKVHAILIKGIYSKLWAINIEWSHQPDSAKSWLCSCIAPILFFDVLCIDPFSVFSNQANDGNESWMVCHYRHCLDRQLRLHVGKHKGWTSWFTENDHSLSFEGGTCGQYERDNPCLAEDLTQAFVLIFSSKLKNGFLPIISCGMGMAFYWRPCWLSLTFTFLEGTFWSLDLDLFLGISEAHYPVHICQTS